jgi:putative Holliday junction resolvase
MPAATSPSGRRIGLDVGRVRIGVAASDEDGRLAFARTVVARRTWRQDLEHLRRLVEAEGAVEIVVGLPLRTDGSEGAAAGSARRFARRVAEATGLEVVLVDERMSSVEAGEGLRAAGLDQRRARARVDAEAARVILQRHLDSLRRPEGDG